jgi:hypothetical protein
MSLNSRSISSEEHVSDMVFKAPISVKFWSSVLCGSMTEDFRFSPAGAEAELHIPENDDPNEGLVAAAG